VGDWTGNSSQHLGSVGLRLAGIEPTAGLHTGEHGSQHRFQATLLQAHHDPSCFAPTELCSFDRAMHGIIVLSQKSKRIEPALIHFCPYTRSWLSFYPLLLHLCCTVET
jgi:hypothetical protein